jgi:hypothetical protein
VSDGIAFVSVSSEEAESKRGLWESYVEDCRTSVQKVRCKAYFAKGHMEHVDLPRLLLATT